MDFDGELRRLSKKVANVQDGCKGRWFEPGECEELKCEFFKEEVPVLLGMVRQLLTQARGGVMKIKVVEVHDSHGNTASAVYTCSEDTIFLGNLSDPKGERVTFETEVKHLEKWLVENGYTVMVHNIDFDMKAKTVAYCGCTDGCLGIIG